MLSPYEMIEDQEGVNNFRRAKKFFSFLPKNETKYADLSVVFALSLTQATTNGHI